MKQSRPTRPDVSIFGRGFYTIQADTSRGASFLRRVQGAQHGVAYCDDTRLTEDIAVGAVRAGLRVEVNGAPYTAGS